MFDLLFLGMYWKHGELKKNCRAKCNCVLWSFVELVYITTIHDLSIHEHLERRFSRPKEHRRASKDHLMKTLPSWKLQIWGALVTKITCTYNLIGPFLVANNKKTIFAQQALQAFGYNNIIGPCAWQTRPCEKTAIARSLSCCNHSMKTRVQYCKQQRSCNEKCLLYRSEDTIEISSSRFLFKPHKIYYFKLFC